MQKYYQVQVEHTFSNRLDKHVIVHILLKNLNFSTVEVAELLLSAKNDALLNEWEELEGLDGNTKSFTIIGSGALGEPSLSQLD